MRYSKFKLSVALSTAVATSFVFAPVVYAEDPAPAPVTSEVRAPVEDVVPTYSAHVDKPSDTSYYKSGTNIRDIPDGWKLVLADSPSAAKNAPKVNKGAALQDGHYWMVREVDTSDGRTPEILDLGVFKGLNKPADVASVQPLDDPKSAMDEWSTDLLSYRIILDHPIRSELRADIEGTQGEVSTEDGQIFIVKFPKESQFDVADRALFLNIETTDTLGNRGNERKSVLLDVAAPSFEDLRASNGSLNRLQQYSSPDAVIVSGIMKDAQSGIKYIKILRDGRVFDTVPVENPNRVQFNYEIRVSGTYSVVLVDKVGRSTDIPLSEFISGTDQSFVLIDSYKPHIRLPGSLNNLPEYPAGSGVHWITSKPSSNDFVITFDDDNDLIPEDAQVTINDRPVKVEGSARSNSLKAVIPWGFMKEGELNTLRVTVRDLANQHSVYEDKFRLSLRPPKVEASTSSPFNNTKWGAFAKRPISYSLSLKDAQDLKIIDTKGTDGIRVANPTEFVLNTTRNGRVMVTDTLRRTQDLSLKDLTGINQSSVVIDDKAPVFGDLSKNSTWINNLSKMDKKVRVQDNAGLGRVVVKVNGKETNSVDFAASNTPGPVKDSQVDLNLEREVKGGGVYTIAVESTDLAGNSAVRQYALNLDVDRPVIENFEIVNPTYTPGQTINGSDKYGLFVNGATRVRVRVTDPGVSSGLRDVVMTLRPEGAAESTITSPVQAGVAEFNLPTGFKGFISAVASDQVENFSEVQRPDGIVEGNSNTRITPNDIQINIPETPFRDEFGHWLFSNVSPFSFSVKALHAGVRSLSYGINDQTLGTVDVDNNGRLSSGGFNVDVRDRNLATALSAENAVTGDVTGASVWVRVKDNTNFETDTSRIVSVDSLDPVLTLSFNQDNPSGFYNSDRIGELRVVEHNFNPSNLKLEGTYGSLGEWRREGDVWTLPIYFNNNQDYEFTAVVNDMAGRFSNTVTSGRFTVDKTAPVASVNWNPSQGTNGKYFNTPRSAEITVIDDHFDPGQVRLSGDGAISSWSSVGNRHTAVVNWTSNGVHTFGFETTDRAGNPSNVLNEPEFIIDTHDPAIDITGVSQGAAYYKTPLVNISYSDEYPDTRALTATLVGRKGNSFDLPIVWAGNRATVSFDKFPNKPEFDDFYTLTVKGSDLAGNRSEKSVQFIVNKFGSHLDVSGADYRGKYLKDPVDVVLQESTVEKLDESKLDIKVTFNGAPIEVPRNAIRIDSSPDPVEGFRYVYTVRKEAFKDEGSYMVQINSVTEGGKQNVSRLSYSFVIDRTPPKILVSGLESNEQYKVKNVDATVTVRDHSPTDLKIVINDEETKIDQDNKEDYKLSIPESSSTYTLRAFAVDKAGNETELNVDNFYINTSWWKRLLANPTSNNWFMGAAGVLTLGTLLLLGWFVARRRRSDDDDTVN